MLITVVASNFFSPILEVLPAVSSDITVEETDTAPIEASQVLHLEALMPLGLEAEEVPQVLATRNLLAQGGRLKHFWDR